MILNNIAKIREEKGLTIRQLEYKTGISKSTLSRIENNETKLYLELLEKISKALDCRVQDLFDIVQEYVPFVKILLGNQNYIVDKINF